MPIWGLLIALLCASCAAIDADVWSEASPRCPGHESDNGGTPAVAGGHCKAGTGFMISYIRKF